MKRYYSTRSLFCLVLILFMAGTKLYSQSSLLDYFPDIDILQSNGPSPGYFVLGTKKFSSDSGSNYIAVIDNYATPLYFRLQNGAAASISTMLEDHIIINEGNPKVFHVYDSLMQVVDTLNTETYSLDGHDFDIDSKDHVLLLGNNRIKMDLTEYGGVSDATIRDKVVQEFDNEGNLLYTWKALDHYQITDANLESPLVDLTASTVDYIHANSLCFDSDTSFLLSARHFDEITKIDRRSGDIIWRLGGKNNVFTFINDSLQFSHQHSIRKLENGNILLFDNGNMHYEQFSSIVEYELDEAALTATLVKRIVHTPRIYADHAGGQELLKNDNYLVYWGMESPSFTEYHPDGSVALEMDFSAHSFSNRIAKSDWNHRMFVTNTDSVNFGMWDGYTESPYLLGLRNNTDSVIVLTGYSTHTPYFYIQDPFPVELPPKAEIQLTIIYYPEGAGTGYIQDIMTINSLSPDLLIAQQVYLEGRKQDEESPEYEIMPDSVNVALDVVPSISFSEPVRMPDGSEITYLNSSELIVFREGGASGTDIAFHSVISTDKKIISITPDELLQEDKTYYIALAAGVEDYSSNSVQPGSVLFSTGETISSYGDNEYTDLAEIFPNPNNGNFSISFKSQAVRSVQLYSSTAILIYSSSGIMDNRLDLSMPGLSRGLYLLIIRDAEGNIISRHKMIIQE